MPAASQRRLDRPDVAVDIAGLEVRALLVAGLAWLGAGLGDRIPGLIAHLTLAQPSAAAVAVTVLILAAALIAVGVGTRSTVPLALGVFFLLLILGASADAAYQPMAAGPLDSEATVVGDPKPLGLGWRAELRLADGRRVDAVGYGPAGWDLSEVSVGEVYRLVGTARPPGERDWYRVRHVAGLVSVDRLEPIGSPGWWWRVPQFVRGAVVAGGETMSERHRALYLGLVIGDDRFQPLGQRLNFRSAGLTHLLAVSGQNVAFVLAVVRVPLALLGRRARLLLTIAVLVVFAVVTRMEPSVMRATAAALLAVWAAASGRQRSGVIILSLAVVCILCIDPFLVDSVGFQLSVAASLGILVLGSTIERRLPGPTWIRAPLATTLSAQIGVAPVLSAYFGPVSVVSIPANLVAGWAAALIMTLGLTVGVVAGLVPDPLAAVLQAPTILLLRWLDWVAMTGGRAQAPRFGPAGLTALAVMALMVGPSRRESGEPDGIKRPVWARTVSLVALIGLLAAAWPIAPSVPIRCGTGISWYPGTIADHGRASDVDPPPAVSALVLGPNASAGAIERCLDSGIRDADVVIAQRGSRRTAELVAALRETMTIGPVLAPPQHRIVGARRVLAAEVVVTGYATLVVVPENRDNDGDRLSVDIGQRQPG